ncbi:yippee family protein [Arthroderma uncinatum]|uniref:yippee family protein n=1 Tax=Arthroderma uncinatum TaxID=74035 RepID=UPI00144A532E|nr:yippee family protein [Arthroderma uncinatum]KAF3492052.1 yippee family protein [Arthroderma uncinatum]
MKEMKFPNYLPQTEADHESSLRCANCAATICLTSQVVSKGFTGRHGRAYLVADPKAAHPAASALANTVAHRAVARQLVTGAHTVSDIACRFCHSVLGWKYIAAEDESQKYKVGKFIVESKRISLSSSWERPSSTSTTTSTTSTDGVKGDEIEFDSQDEDECEDLFSGIWTPSLAKRRRRRKQRSS